MTLFPNIPNDISSSQLRCQTVNHPWDDMARPQGVHTSFSMTAWYRCPNCGMVKQEAYNVYGDVIYRRYWRPAGWKKLSRDVRRSHLRRMYRSSMFDLHEPKDSDKVDP